MDFIPLSKPDIGSEEINAVVKTMKSGWLTMGQNVLDFEKAFAEKVGAKYAIAVNSCTAALHLSLEAADVGPGDEVITSPFTFAATAGVIEHLQATPVFVDIEEDTMNIDPEKIEEALSWRTAAIMPVHFAGLPCNMRKIFEVAGPHDLPIVEDAAHAFPVTHNGQMVGSIGDLTCFSFYPTKPITTAEGGMVTTDNEVLADRIRIMRLHGISKHAWQRYKKEGNWRYNVIAAGFKYNLTDIAAAIGLEQLKKIDRMKVMRVTIADTYNEAFKHVPEMEIPKVEEGTDHAWHLYIIRLNLETLKINRDQFIEELKKRGVGASVHCIPLHLFSYYVDTYGYKPEDFPVANSLYPRILSLPFYAGMNIKEQLHVIEAVTDTIKENRR